MMIINNLVNQSKYCYKQFISMLIPGNIGKDPLKSISVS